MNPMTMRWAKLYRDMTEPELVIEPAIASLGVSYRVQHPFFLFGAVRFFPDFLLLNERVVIEIDDKGHFSKAGIAKDKIRTETLVRAGYRVVRVRNEDAIRDPYGEVDRCMAELGLTLRTRRPGAARG